MEMHALAAFGSDSDDGGRRAGRAAIWPGGDRGRRPCRFRPADERSAFPPNRGDAAGGAGEGGIPMAKAGSRWWRTGPPPLEPRGQGGRAAVSPRTSSRRGPRLRRGTFRSILDAVCAPNQVLGGRRRGGDEDPGTEMKRRGVGSAWMRSARSSRTARGSSRTSRAARRMARVTVTAGTSTWWTSADIRAQRPDGRRARRKYRALFHLKVMPVQT